ncbi:MAG TPA: hypothetical protein VHX64_17950 [Caulobacteraceae bacterium]|nr:hypothetical protein [Caulobacteraceae bacterium]
MAGAAHGAPGDCDRACLTGLADRYVDALVAHDPSRLPLAPEVKFTENLVPLKLGREGLWLTANGRRDYNIYAADPARGDVVWIGIVKENDTPEMAAVRLKVAAGKITEVETVVGRVGLSAAATVAGPRPDFARVEPAATRRSREQLIAIASSNWDAMENGDGTLAPYAADCERYDNGRKTTDGPSPGPTAAGAEPATAASKDIGDLGCFGQMNSGRFRNGSKVDPRRAWAVDPEHGLVVGLYTPNVPGTARELTLRNGQVLKMGPDEMIPFTIVQAEMFKIVDGQISRVEVVLGPRVPFGMRSPFDMKTLWATR